MNSGPPPLCWLVASAADGALRVQWPAPTAPVARAHLLVCLRAVSPDDTEAFWAGDLDTDLIRHPVDAAACAATVPVPSGRELHLTLVFRDAADAVVPAPPLRTAEPPPAVLEAPVHHHSPDDGAPPALVFVRGTQSPDLSALARRVALAAGAHAPPATGPRPFAARARWSLVRLRFTPPDDAPLLLVRRTAAIEPADLDAFALSPPPDAIEVPPNTDAIVDGEPAPESIAFYALLAGPAPWRALPLAPQLPPFDDAARLFALGPVEDRLAPAVLDRLDRLGTTPVALGELPLALALLEAAVRFLPSASPLRRLVDDRVAHHRHAPRY